VKADDGIYVVSYLGDATGNGSYSALDATLILRVSAGLDSGFASYLLLDPLVIGDITANGSFSALDATRMLQEIVGLDRVEIPPVPTGFVLPVPVADPLVTIGNIGGSFTGTPGSTVTIPVNIDNADLLESVELRIAYDTTLLDVAASGVRKGSLTGASTLIVNVDDAAGLVYVSMVMTRPLSAGAGSLLEIDFKVSQKAAAGETRIDLQSLSLNEGQLVLTIVPVNGADSTDGLLTIQSVAASENLVAKAENPISAIHEIVPARVHADLSYLGRALDQLEDRADENIPGDWFRKLVRARKPLRQGSSLR